MPHSADRTPTKAAVQATLETYTYSDSTLTGSTADTGTEALGDNVCLDNGLLQLNFSRTTGRLESIKNRQAGITANVTLDISAYLSGQQ